MDADYDPESRDLQSELIENTKKRKRRRRSKFAELIAKEKPKFDPKQYPSYAHYFDQYYSLDYEDMIGDLPCRFKYRKVVPNDYGLSIEEILMADDKELNRWCPLRQTLKHKPEHVEKNEVRIYKEKAKNEAHKRKILKSLYTELEEKEEKNEFGKKDEKNKSEQEGNVVNKIKKQKRKNKLTADGNALISKKMKIDNATKKDFQIKTETNIKENNDEKIINKSASRKKNRNNKSSQFNQINTGKHKPDDDPTMSLNADRLKIYGINAKKLKNKLKYSNRQM